MAAVAVRRAGATTPLVVPLSIPWRWRQIPVVEIGAAAPITRPIPIPIIHPLPGISVPPTNGRSLLGGAAREAEVAAPVAQSHRQRRRRRWQRGICRAFQGSRRACS